MNTSIKNIIIEAFKSERDYFTKQITDRHSDVNKLTKTEFLKAVMETLVSEDGCMRFDAFYQENKDATYDKPELIALGLLIDEVRDEVSRENFSHSKSLEFNEIERQRQRDTFAMARGLKPFAF